jgi:hypothetical protein
MESDTQSTALPTAQWFRHNLKWIGILAFLFLAGLVLWRLGVGFSFLDEDEKQALEMVELFHERMNAGHFDEVYDDAHPEFRHALSRQEWLRHMKETREDLGLYRLRRSQTLNVIMGPPVQVRVYYHATFEQGDGNEQFSFARNGDKLQLLEYGIMSPQWSRHFARAFSAGVTSPLHSQPGK